MSIAAVFLFAFWDVSSATVELFSEFDFKESFMFVELLCAYAADIGGGTGVTTGLLLVGSLFTRRTWISPVRLFK